MQALALDVDHRLFREQKHFHFPDMARFRPQLSARSNETARTQPHKPVAALCSPWGRVFDLVLDVAQVSTTLEEPCMRVIGDECVLHDRTAS